MFGDGSTTAGCFRFGFVTTEYEVLVIVLSFKGFFFCGPGCWRAVVGSLFCFSMSGLAIVLFGFGQFLYDESLL